MQMCQKKEIILKRNKPNKKMDEMEIKFNDFSAENETKTSKTNKPKVNCEQNANSFFRSTQHLSITRNKKKEEKIKDQKRKVKLRKQNEKNN